MTYFRVLITFLGALTLLSCASTPTTTKQFSNTISKNINYANYNSVTNELDGNLILWQPVSQLKLARQQGLSRMGMNDMTYKRYFCATYLFGIDANGELRDVVLQNTYGDAKLALKAVNTLKTSQWTATEHNPERKPGIYVLDMFNFRANDPHMEQFIQHCPTYIDANVNSFTSPKQLDEIEVNKFQRLQSTIK